MPSHSKKARRAVLKALSANSTTTFKAKHHGGTGAMLAEPDYETVLLVMKSMYVMLSLCFPHTA